MIVKQMIRNSSGDWIVVATSVETRFVVAVRQNEHFTRDLRENRISLSEISKERNEILEIDLLNGKTILVVEDFVEINKRLGINILHG